MRRVQWVREDGTHWCTFHKDYHDAEKFRAGPQEGRRPACRIGEKIYRTRWLRKPGNTERQEAWERKYQETHPNHKERKRLQDRDRYVMRVLRERGVLPRPYQPRQREKA